MELVGKSLTFTSAGMIAYCDQVGRGAEGTISGLLLPDVEIHRVPLPQPVQELLQGGRWGLG